MLTATRPADADELAELAVRLGLIEPRLAHRQARALAAAGDLDTAVSVADTAVASWGGSSDRG